MTTGYRPRGDRTYGPPCQCPVCQPGPTERDWPLLWTLAVILAAVFTLAAVLVLGTIQGV